MTIDPALNEGPSGEPIPITMPGWGKRVFFDDFRGGAIDPNRWWTWNGQPGGSSDSWWLASHVRHPNDSCLHLDTFWETQGPPRPMLVSGGVGCKSYIDTYGLILARWKRDYAIPNVSDPFMLYPLKGWPPELDFFESGGENLSTSGTNHWSPGNQSQQFHKTGVDMTQWHTWGVEWTPNLYVCTVDGVEWCRFSDNVPSQPMRFDFETWFMGGEATDPGVTSTLSCDWTARFAMA